MIKGTEDFRLCEIFFRAKKKLIHEYEKTIHTETQRQLKLSWPLLVARTLELGRDFQKDLKEVESTTV